MKLAAFVAGLGLLFAAVFVTARTVDDDGLASKTGASIDEHGGHTAEVPSAETPALPGLAVAQAGYRFVPDAAVLPATQAAPFRFRIDGPSGHPVERFDTLHDRELHLIAVRRDLAGFQHLHPTRLSGGSWAIDLDLRLPGTWRVFADFSPTGGPGQLTLGVDLQVAGDFQPAATPSAVTASGGGAVSAELARQGDQLTATVRRDGHTVQPEPYLGARGHVVALRAGDLAYLHVHPERTDGPEVRFRVELPTPGTYALFLDYQLDGTVRTAVSTTEVEA